jgi:hypothetical protein
MISRCFRKRLSVCVREKQTYYLRTLFQLQKLCMNWRHNHG